MTDTKLAVSWGDVLLLAAVAIVGSGICALSAVVVGYFMAPGVPKEAALSDSLGVPRLEQRVVTAREDRGFLLAQRREVGMQRARDAAALRMNDDDLRSLGPPAPRTRSAVRDSLERARVALARSRRADSLMALALDSMMARADDSVAVRASALEQVKAAVDAQLRRAQIWHAAAKILWTALGAIAGVGFLVLLIQHALRPRPGDTSPSRAAYVVVPAVLLIALVFMHQVGGPMLTVSVASVVATLFLIWTLTRVVR